MALRGTRPPTLALPEPWETRTTYVTTFRPPVEKPFEPEQSGRQWHIARLPGLLPSPISSISKQFHCAVPQFPHVENAS